MASRDLVVADATVHYRIGANVVKLCRLFRSSEGKYANLHSKESLDVENLSAGGQFELLIVADEYARAAGRHKVLVSRCDRDACRVRRGATAAVD